MVVAGLVLVVAGYSGGGDQESLQGWLETSERLGGIVVFYAVDVWALSLENDGPLRTFSAKLATRIGRALVTPEAWQIRTIGGR